MFKHSFSNVSAFKHLSLMLVFGILFILSSCLHVEETNRLNSLDFDRLLAPPAASEIEEVWSEWRSRDVSPEEVKLVTRHEIEIGETVFDARIFSYNVDGAAQYGAAFVPLIAENTAKLPVIIGARGVEWDYPVRNLSSGPYIATLMSEGNSDFIFLSPVLRGHSFRFGETQYDASGDRRDSWDGATDDMIAFLTVALAEIPEADPDRVMNFGYSRGGAVALLHGARDKRVNATVAFAAPVDFFSLMARPGESWIAALENAYSTPDFPADTRESQFLEWFVTGRETLGIEEMRRRIIASSPLYFANAMPASQVHHGAQDSAVPARNASALRNAFLQNAKQRPDYEVFIYENYGHALEGSGAQERARNFFLRYAGIAVKDAR